ncbi:MAG: alpha/beta fold hydrolase [Chloroflexi bacterium]|nr:alpha/beta fold hydrolase [Chloroflexota bacterium]
MAGAEPFSFSGRGEVGVLLVHGFTGTPFEVRPLGEHLAGQDIASSGVLLRGHGTHPNDMLGCRYQDWIDDAEAGLEELLRTNRGVVLVGFSMGGTIALNIAARRADDARILGVVAICSPLRLVDWRLGFVQVLRRLIRWQAWGKPDIKDRTAWERHVAYRRFRTDTVPQLLGLLRDTRAALPRVRHPLLVIQSREDNVVPPLNAGLIVGSVGSDVKRLVWLDNCYHMVTLDYAASTVLAEVSRFIAELHGPRGAAATPSDRGLTMPR